MRSTHAADAIRAHDQQRDFSDAAWASIVQDLVGVFPAGSPVLDVGAGTCLYTHRLVAAGANLVACDVNSSMLAAARDSGRGGFPILVADGQRLPFVDGAFGGALLCQVAHLFPEPRRAYAELARVLQRDATLVINPGNVNRSADDDRIRDKFNVAAGISPAPRSRQAAIDDLVAKVSAAGFESAPSLEVNDRVSRTVGGTIEVLARNPFGGSALRGRWRRARAAQRVRRWATREFGSLDATYPLDVEMTFLVLRRV